MPLASQLKFCIQYVRERYFAFWQLNHSLEQVPTLLEINYFNNDSGDDQSFWITDYNIKFNYNVHTK
jgi:hypothetical protein